MRTVMSILVVLIIPKRGSPKRRWRCSTISTTRPSISSPITTIPNAEPAVLPARFPNLLVNGAGGIAVGMATNIPPHNLGEVIDACIALADDPALVDRRPDRHRAGPGFPDRRHPFSAVQGHPRRLSSRSAAPIVMRGQES